jgi:hypothetical protein
MLPNGIANGPGEIAELSYAEGVKHISPRAESLR